MMRSACGGASGGGSQKAAWLSGNWQFAVTPPADGSFLGGLQGGFLLQKNSSVTGAVVYSVSLPQSGGSPTVCNSGSAPIMETISGQTLALTAVAGTQTFTFTGTLSSDGSTVAGTYASTPGTAAGGSPFRTVPTGLRLSAGFLAALTGSVHGWV